MCACLRLLPSRGCEPVVPEPPAAGVLRVGGAPSSLCPPPPPLAGAAGMPCAAWDRARMEVLREELCDELVWQRLLARMAADPQRYYPPWAQPIG